MFELMIGWAIGNLLGNIAAGILPDAPADPDGLYKGPTSDEPKPTKKRKSKDPLEQDGERWKLATKSGQ